MWLLTILIWNVHGLDAFTKELPTYDICNEVGHSYLVMAGNKTSVQYQCVKIK